MQDQFGVCRFEKCGDDRIRRFDGKFFHHRNFEAFSAVAQDSSQITLSKTYICRKKVFRI